MFPGFNTINSQRRNDINLKNHPSLQQSQPNRQPQSSSMNPPYYYTSVGGQLPISIDQLSTFSSSSSSSSSIKSFANDSKKSEMSMSEFLDSSVSIDYIDFVFSSKTRTTVFVLIALLISIALYSAHKKSTETVLPPFKVEDCEEDIVTLYEDVEFTGKRIRLPRGKYNVNQLNIDMIKSIQVSSPNIQVILHPKQYKILEQELFYAKQGKNFKDVLNEFENNLNNKNEETPTPPITDGATDNFSKRILKEKRIQYLDLDIQKDMSIYDWDDVDSISIENIQH
jgi:hypothetical protein